MKSIDEIGIDELFPDPGQPRKSFLQDELARLADSIAARGLLMPIRVIRDEERQSYRIICGESRWRAARLAGLSTVSCMVVEGELSETDALADQIIENSVRRDLTPLELGRSIVRLKALRKCTSQALASELGISGSAVTRAEALLTLPQDVQTHIDSGRLAESAAYELSRLPDEESQRKMLTELLAGRLTRDQVAKAVRSKLAGKKAPKAIPRLLYKLGGSSLTVSTGKPLTWRDLNELIDRLRREIRKFTEGDGGADPATPFTLS